MNEMTKIVLAKIVRDGDRQVIELPTGFGFDGEEVNVFRSGDCIVLEPPGAIDEETGLPLAELRRLVQEGIDSGDAGPWDVEEIKREARARFATRSDR